MVTVVVSISCGIRPSSLRRSRRAWIVSMSVPIPHTNVFCSLSKKLLNSRGGWEVSSRIRYVYVVNSSSIE